MAVSINPDSVTTVENVFTITNQGAQSVGLWLQDGSDAVTFKVGGQSIEGEENAIAVDPGDTKPVSIEIDTRNADVNRDLLNSVTFKSNTDVAGRAVPDQGEGGSGGAESDESASDDEQSGSSDPTPTPKAEEDDDDDGGGASQWLDDNVVDPVNEHVVEPAAETTNDVIKAGGELLRVTGDFFNSVADWGRQKLLEKFSYVTNQPLDALKSLGETAWNTLIGFFIGEIGMPGGSFEAQEADSAFYLGGSMLSVLNPITDTVAGIRDLAANLVKGDPLGAAIEALGLLPGGSVMEDLTDLKKMGETWVKHYPSKAAKRLQPLSDTILKRMPTSAQREIEGVFPKALPPGVDDLAKRDDLVGYTTSRMDRLRNGEGFTNTDIKRLADRNVDLRMVEGLSKNGVSNAKIKELSKTDADLEAARRLSGRGFSGDHLTYIAKHGDETNPKLTLKRAEALKNEGYKAEDIVFISKNAESKYVMRARGTNKPDSGVMTGQLHKLSEQEIPADDVRYYVENSFSLKLVSFLREQGHSSGRIRNFLLGSPEKVKNRVKEIRAARDRGSSVAGAAKDTYSWCKMKEKGDDPVCPI